MLNRHELHLNEIFNRFANTVPCGLYEYTLDKDGKGYFHYLNDRAIEIFEIKEEEVTHFGEIIWTYFSKKDSRRIAELDRVSNKTGNLFFFEAKIKTRTKNSKWIRMSSLPSNSYYKGSQIWSGYVLDISNERKLAIEAIERECRLSVASHKVIRYEEVQALNVRLEKVLAEKNLLLSSTAAYAKANELGGLVSSLAHEINNPLGVIGVNSQSLALEVARIKKEGLKNDTVKNLEDIALGLIGANSRVTKVIANLRNLFVKRSDAYEAFDLSDVTLDICELMSQKIDANKINMQKSIDKHISIRGDKGQIQMVFLNAINNAVDALKEINGVRVMKLSLTKNGGKVCFSVMDNGSGFKDDFLARAFELFQTTKSKGMGIGLWLSRAIIENHGGMISADNLPDGGAIIKIVLYDVL